MLILLLLLLFIGQTVSAQTVSELIEAGRIAEARQRVEGVDSLARYRDYLAAAAEMDAARACSLYQVVSWRYPETDVDRLAQERLLAYQAWGQSLPPFVAPGWSMKTETPETLKEVSTSQATQPQEAVAIEPPPATVTPQPSPEPEVIPAPKVEKQETPKQPELQKEVAKPAASEPSVHPISEPPKMPHDVGVGEGGRFWVQVGAFGVRENADKLADKLRGGGYSVEIFSIQSTKTLLHHVRVGGYPTREAAQATGEKLKEDFGLEFRLVEM
jgi:cell division septation protein DedD